jgi:hypothetical protein
LEAAVTSLTAQRDELRGHVEALDAYLAGERGRVLDTLQSAVDNFSAALVASERPTAVAAAFNAPIIDKPVVNEPVINEPSVAETAVEDDAPPAADVAFAVGGDDLAWIPRDASWPEWPAADEEAVDEHPSPVDVWFSTRHETPDPAVEAAPDIEPAKAIETVSPLEAVSPLETSEAIEPAATGAPDEADEADAADAVDAQPSSLLFRLEHELRRPETERPEERSVDKPRKPILGRRRG